MRMARVSLVVAAVVAAVGAASSAQAGFFADVWKDPAPAGLDLQVDAVCSEGSTKPDRLVVNADVISPDTVSAETGFNFTFGGTVIGDPTVEVLEKVKNSGTTAWNTYTVTVTPVDPVASTNVQIISDFSMPGYPNIMSYLTNTPVVTTGLPGGAIRVVFSGSGSHVINPGQKVTIDWSFDISDEAYADFAYTIANKAATITTPAPEPATISVLAAGAAGLMLRRRRR